MQYHSCAAFSIQSEWCARPLSGRYPPFYICHINKGWPGRDVGAFRKEQTQIKQLWGCKHKGAFPHWPIGWLLVLTRHLIPVSLPLHGDRQSFIAATVVAIIPRYLTQTDVVFFNSNLSIAIANSKIYIGVIYALATVWLHVGTCPRSTCARGSEMGNLTGETLSSN